MARSFQRVNIFPRKSVFENVQVASDRQVARPWRQSRSAAAKACSATRRRICWILVHTLRTRPKGAGRRTRLRPAESSSELALALACGPQAAPAGRADGRHVDRGDEGAAIRLINDIVDQRRGLTLLFTEHDMGVVFEIATHVSGPAPRPHHRHRPAAVGARRTRRSSASISESD